MKPHGWHGLMKCISILADGGTGDNFLLRPTTYVPPLLLLCCQAVSLLLLLSALIALLSGKHAEIAATAMLYWDVERVRFVHEYKEERDVLPPPLNVLPPLLYHKPFSQPPPAVRTA